MSLNFIMNKSNERFPINPSILTEGQYFLGLHNLSVYNSVYNVTEKNNKIRYSERTTSNENSATFMGQDIVLEPGACAFDDLQEIIKQKSDGKVIISINKQTMKVGMKTSVVVNLAVENSIADVL